MSVKNKLISSFVFVTLLAVFVGVTGLFAFQQIKGTFQEIVDIRLPEMAMAQQLAEQSQTVVSTAPLMLTAQNDEERVKI